MTFNAYIMEYERGWASRVDETREFETEEARDKFIEDYNKYNTSQIVPDWYMVAQKA